jgi:hypothetical protein
MSRCVQGCVFLLLTLVGGGCKRHSPATGCPHDANLSTYEQWKQSVSFRMQRLRLEKTES